MRLPKILPLVLVLSACQYSFPAPPPPSPLPDESCGAAELQGLVGQPASVLQTLRFSQVVRVIRPGMMVTMDYSPQRLNIQVDAAEKITALTCG